MNNIDAAFCFSLGIVAGYALFVIIGLMGDSE